MNDVLGIVLQVVWRFEDMILRVRDGGQRRTKHDCEVDVLTAK